MSGWAACLPTKRAHDLAALRLFPDIDFAEVHGVYWLRGASLDETLERELKKVPGLDRFELLPAERLRPVESRIPDRILPNVQWQPLKQCFSVTLPVAVLGGESQQRIPVMLVRDSREQPAAALGLPLNTWVTYASTAPLVRLGPLRFAAMEGSQALVIGTPLPSLPGRRYSEESGVLVPCGFTWSPAVDPGVLQQLFKLGRGDVVVLAEDNTHQTIRAEQFVAASRSASRLSLEQEPNDG